MITDSSRPEDNRALTTSTFEAERRLTWTRLVVMASGTIIFPLLIRERAAVIPWLAYALLASGWAYSLGVLLFEPYRRYPVLLSATFTTVVDSILTVLWVFATGGAESPWTVAIFASIVLVSLRHRPRHTLLAATLCAVAYVLSTFVLGQLARSGADVGVHVLYMFIIAAAAAIVARERLSRLTSRLALLDITQEVAQVGTWEWSLAEKTLSWSEELHRVFDLPRTVQPTFELYLERAHPDDRAQVERRVAQALAEATPFRFDHRIVTPGGAVRWLHCRGRVTVDSHGKPRELVGSAQEITERKEMQAQLLVSGKLASIGTLASGIAHEINNPLAYVANNLEVLDRHLETIKGRLSPEELQPLRSAVESARHGAARMSAIVGGLKTYARPEDPRRSVVDLARAADLAIEIASHEITHRARLVRDYSPAAPVHANESRLSQVLVNLLVNAAHAIERGGVADNEIRVRIYEDDAQRPCVEISDTGSGVSPEHVERIFDPFFTTKPTGMGLGLSVSSELLRDFGGEIELARTGAEGSTFRVTLRAAPADAVVPPEPRTPVPARPTTRKRLLVVDDETRYADSLRLLLGADHEVDVANSAERALAVLSSGRRFDAILCDLMMPGKTGIDLYEELMTRTPDVCARVVFLTGGGTSERARAFLARPDIRHLEKPVELPVLEAVIATVTGSGGGPA